ncbi:MAG: aminopeptidase 1 [Lachnospiraceae bacterium]|nr:aminopeptidase 1 [Lachnospiraceae bacterium]
MTKKKNAWSTYTEKQLEELEALSGNYRAFLDAGKTERECVTEITRIARENGYRSLDEVRKDGGRLQPGDKVYASGMGKTIALFVIGKQPLEAGMRILGAHIDSPRLDVKQDPLYEDSELAYLDTHYYGGIKKYQWVTVPLALHGVVVKKDGTRVPVCIGEDDGDPVLFVSDLLVHLAGEQLQKKASVVIEGENLDILVGSRPISKAEKETNKCSMGSAKCEASAKAEAAEKSTDGAAQSNASDVGKSEAAAVTDPAAGKNASDAEKKEAAEDKKAEKEAVKQHILAILRDKYGMEEEDFLSAELEAVPAAKARDCGLDRSMIMAYGQDDRVCAYTSLAALLDTPAQDYTCCCLLVDKEEIGSVGATGMQSRFFENTVAELMDCMGQYSELALRRALSHCRMLSSDVSAAYDPLYASCFDKKNSAFFGGGLVLNKYTGSRGKGGSNDANAEYIASVRALLDKHEVLFQNAEIGKVDVGGGGTIAYIAALYGMEVIDSGVAVMNMHAPMEVTSKADVYEALRGYRAFLAEA